MMFWSGRYYFVSISSSSRRRVLFVCALSFKRELWLTSDVANWLISAVNSLACWFSSYFFMTSISSHIPFSYHSDSTFYNFSVFWFALPVQCLALRVTCTDVSSFSSSLVCLVWLSFSFSSHRSGEKFHHTYLHFVQLPTEDFSSCYFLPSVDGVLRGVLLKVLPSLLLTIISILLFLQVCTALHILVQTNTGL